MRNRPAVKVLIPYLAGIIIADRFDFSPMYLWSLSAVLMVCVFVAYKKKWFSSGSALIVLFLLFIGFFQYEISMIPPAGIEKVLYQQVKVQGVVVKSQKERSGGSSLIVKGEARSLSDPSISMSGKISIRSWEDVFPQKYGDVVEIEGLLSRPRLPRNPGAFDYRKYLAHRGIFVTIDVETTSDVQPVGVGGNFFLRWVHGLREKMESVIDETMPPESASVLKGITLGDRAALSEDMYQAFLRTGTSHILAVSGLHIGIIAGWTLLLCNWIRKLIGFRNRVIVYMPVIAVVIVYASMIGFRASVVRASALVIMVFVAAAIDRDTDLFNLLAMAALAILIYRPGAFFDVGFQLSFGVVASILYLMTHWEKWLSKIKEDFLQKYVGNWLERLREGQWYHRMLLTMPISSYRILQIVFVSMSAQVGAMLITAYTFNGVSLVGVLANPIVIPIVGLIAPIGFVSYLLGMIYLPLVKPFAYVNHILISWLTSIVSYLSRFRFSYVAVSWFSFWHIVVFAAVIVFTVNLSILLKQRRRLIISGAALTAILIWAMALSYNGHVLKATCLDVGQGDSIFVDLPNGRNILIDGGPYSARFDTGKRVVSPFLQYEGVSRLDLVVSTHPHNDHAGGLTYLVQNEDNVNFRIGQVITGSYGLTTPTFQELRSRLDRRGIEYRDAQIGSVFKDDEVHVEVVGPQYPDLSGDEDSRMNNNSVVLRVTYKGVSFLFASDISEESERLLIDSGRDIRAQVLKVPHQGSDKSSSWEFLRAVQPYIGIISVGWNFFGHPSQLILGRCRWLGIKTYRTDERGAITVVTDGRRGWIKTKSR